MQPNNLALQTKLEQVRALRRAKQFTVPTTIEEELTYNPFLRTGERSIREQLESQGFVGLDDEVAVLAAIREWKNRF